MRKCRRVRSILRDPIALSPEGLPAELVRHLEICLACRLALMAARLARGAVVALAHAAEPPACFPEQVRAALSAQPISNRVPGDPWRSAWGLFPAFAAVVAGLFLLYQPPRIEAAPGLLATDDLSISESLVLGDAVPTPDLVLAVVLEDARD